MHQYRWYINGNRWSVYKGSSLRGDFHCIGSGYKWRRKNRLEEIVKVIQHDMNLYGAWRRSEGGNSPVSNNWSVKPWIVGLKSPDGNPAKPYDYWPSSWGPEPTEEEYARKSQLGYFD